MTAVGLTLSAAEIAELTDRKQPSKQLAELHRRGFWRAALGPSGRVMLEREHYAAVCRGDDRKQQQEPPKARQFRTLVELRAAGLR